MLTAWSVRQINANGPSTRLSGGIPRPEVVEAMAAATQSCVDIAHLQGRASEIIAEFTGAEAGYVTAGAAAGLLLGTAACITRMDPVKMNALPNLDGLKSEVVMARSHRNFYDKAVRAVGVELIEVGLADRYAGAGVRDAEAWEYAAAINERTAMVLYVMNDDSEPPLAEVIEVAHEAGVPVLVDAAGHALPPSNLKKFIAMGADLVAFSGGKAIGGPQASGVLCGRRELIGAAALQHLDMDIYMEQWVPPPQLIDKEAMVGAPHHGIGRSCKVGREAIVGLLVALRLVVEEDPAERHRVFLSHMEELASGLAPLEGLGCRIELEPGDADTVPGLKLVLPEEQCVARVLLQIGAAC